MPTECHIVFDNNPARVFYAGQLLSGHVELSLSEAKSLRGIYVEISGKAYCHWTEGTGDNKKSYTGRETYLDERTYLVGGRGGEITVEAGSYRYDFHCNLPAGLPTSLEAEIGHIRYTARVVLDIPIWPDKEFVEVFTVIKPLNLNYDPTLRLPMFKEKYKVFYPCCICCCCPSDPMHLVVRIPVSGYTPGQSIDIEIDVDNKSEENAEFVVRLMKEITFYAHANSGKTRTETIMVCEKEQVGLSHMNSFEAIRTSLVILPIPPTDETTSNICKVRYILRVLGAVTGCHNDPYVDLPITIGSYPILDNLNITSYPSDAAAAADGYVFPVSYPTAPPALPITQQPVAPTAHHPLLPQNGATALTLPLSPPPPAGSHFPIAPPVYPAAGAAQTPSAFGPSPTPGPPYPTAPFPEDDPPSYEQAMKGNEVSGKTFQPTYPVYRRQTSYSSSTA